MKFILENSGQNKPPDRLGFDLWFWKTLFTSILAFYCIFYTTCGINETDGGFITGLAWQLMSGKVLYSDVIYVRPPLPVWLRAIELHLLPEHWAILGERWIFFLKVGLYSWLGAAVLTNGARRWMLATFGFVVSVHCYPPMAWHTVDGIMFSVLGIWFLANLRGRTEVTLFKKVLLLKKGGAVLGSISIFAALLCKQSFYPMAIVFAGLLVLENNRQRIWWGTIALILCSIFFFSYLYSNGLIGNYLRMTGGSASGSQALQHGVLDYFRIKPMLASGSLLLLAPVAWYFSKGKNPKIAVWCWAAWLVLLAGSYTYEIWRNQTFTVPFAQARLLFWVGLMFLVICHSSFIIHHSSLLAVSWCASVSWGYNLPVLFATPWVFAAMEISRFLWQRAYPRLRLTGVNIIALSMLLLVFRFGYEYVYRDGRRSQMNTHLGQVFPALGGIYSTHEKGQLYLDLKNLAARYPNFKTLPAFPQTNFLTKTPPPLPLDWVVNRETNGDNALILKNIEEKKPVLFVEKAAIEKSRTDPELSFTRDFLRSGTILDETAHFLVIQPK